MQAKLPHPKGSEQMFDTSTVADALHSPLMSRDLQPVGLDFFTSAPYRVISTEVVHRSAAQIFDAIASDPAGWGNWFPGFSHAGRYTTPPPHCAGSRRWMTMGGLAYDETILAWEPEQRWAFRVDRASVPFAYALAEDYQVSDHDVYSIVQWTFAIDPKPALRPAMAALKRVVPAVFRRAMTNLSHHLT